MKTSSPDPLYTEGVANSVRSFVFFSWDMKLAQLMRSLNLHVHFTLTQCTPCQHQLSRMHQRIRVGSNRATKNRVAFNMFVPMR